MPTQRTGAQIIWECLVHEGVTTVFGYPGGAILPAYDAMLDYPVKHVLVRHEQGASHMADGYARAGGGVGVAMATSGPGATNLVTGIATAMMDSVPMVCITGQVPSKLIGYDAFQETDITGITLPITKHNYLVKEANALARTLLQKADAKGVKVVLPLDVVVAPSLEATSGDVAAVDAIPADVMALDVGPKTIEAIGAELRRAKTVFWNGPMGLFETPAFAKGTFEVARIMSGVEGFTVVGGGDSAAAVKQAGDEIAKGFDHISTGGGASLEFVEGKKLPGVEALRVPDLAS